MQWPPNPNNTVVPKLSRLQMEAVVWTLHDRFNGKVYDKSGQVWSKYFWPELEHNEAFTSISSAKRAVKDLEQAGILSLRVNGKRTFTIELNVDPKAEGIPRPSITLSAPDDDPEREPEPATPDDDSTTPVEEPEPTPAPVRAPVVTPEPTTPEFTEHKTFDIPTKAETNGTGGEQADMVSLLMESVALTFTGMAGIASLLANNNGVAATVSEPTTVSHYQRVAERAQERVATAEKDAEILRGRLKAAMVDKAEAERQRDVLSGNLQRVLKEADRWFKSLGDNVPDGAERALRQLVASVPGDVRQR